MCFWSGDVLPVPGCSSLWRMFVVLIPCFQKNFDVLADFEILEMFRTCYVNVVCVRCTLLTPQVQLWVGE